MLLWGGGCCFLGDGGMHSWGSIASLGECCFPGRVLLSKRGIIFPGTTLLQSFVVVVVVVAMFIPCYTGITIPASDHSGEKKKRLGERLTFPSATAVSVLDTNPGSDSLFSAGLHHHHVSQPVLAGRASTVL